MIGHNKYDSDAYKRPVFTTANKLKRLIWRASWLFLCSWTPATFHSWRISILRLFGARIGNSNFIYPSAKIWAPWLLQTEDVVTIGPGVEIYNPGGVLLADHSILSQDAYLCGATHNYNSIDFTYIENKITIERYAWICAKSIVLPGVRCGAGSVLGAGSVASRDLDPWVVYAGNPAKVVNKRNPVVESAMETIKLPSHL